MPSTWSIFSRRFVVAEAVRAAGQHVVVGRRVDDRTAVAEQFRLHARGQLGHFFLRRRRRLVAFAHHHPAREIEHGLAVLIGAARAHIDDTGLLVGIFLQPDHFRHRIERVAGIDGFEEVAIGIAEIGHGVERNVRHRLAEHHVENQEIVNRRVPVADLGGEGVGRLHGKARAEQAVVKRHVADRDRARRGVADVLAETEILEKIAWIGLGEGDWLTTKLLHPIRPGLAILTKP